MSAGRGELATKLLGLLNGKTTVVDEEDTLGVVKGLLDLGEHLDVLAVGHEIHLLDPIGHMPPTRRAFTKKTPLGAAKAGSKKLFQDHLGWRETPSSPCGHLLSLAAVRAVCSRMTHVIRKVFLHPPRHTSSHDDAILSSSHCMRMDTRVHPLPWRAYSATYLTWKVRREKQNAGSVNPEPAFVRCFCLATARRLYCYSARKSRVTAESTLTPGPIVEEKATDLT